MLGHLPLTRIHLVREYAEALETLVRQATDVSAPPPIAIAHAMHHYTAMIARRLGVGAPPHANGLTTITLHETRQQLDEFDTLLARAHHTRLISPTRYDLITGIRTALEAEIAALQREASAHE